MSDGSDGDSVRRRLLCALESYAMEHMSPVSDEIDWSQTGTCVTIGIAPRYRSHSPSWLGTVAGQCGYCRHRYLVDSRATKCPTCGAPLADPLATEGGTG